MTVAHTRTHTQKAKCFVRLYKRETYGQTILAESERNEKRRPNMPIKQHDTELMSIFLCMSVFDFNKIFLAVRCDASDASEKKK